MDSKPGGMDEDFIANECWEQAIQYCRHGNATVLGFKTPEKTLEAIDKSPKTVRRLATDTSVFEFICGSRNNMTERERERTSRSRGMTHYQRTLQYVIVQGEWIAIFKRKVYKWNAWTTVVEGRKLTPHTKLTAMHARIYSGRERQSAKCVLTAIHNIQKAIFICILFINLRHHRSCRTC